MIQKINQFTVLTLFACSFSYGQITSYNHQRELIGVKDTWHSISLPIGVLSKTKTDLSDIRIYGLKESGDTIEAPYVLRMKTDKVTNNKVDFNIINSSTTKDGSYYTFEVLEEVSLNTIDLTFDKQNFDWKVQLEGSQSQNEWFTILDSYRIVSIQNSITSFSFTTLSIPTSKYRFYRLFVPSKTDPDLSSVSIKKREIQGGSYHSLQFVKTAIRKDTDKSQTIIDLELASRVHLRSLSINVSDTFDYYRPLKIKALVDSFKTEKGWKYQYQTIGIGTLNSFRPNDFLLKKIAAQQLQLVIENQDNQPLKIGTISAKGNKYEVTARFIEDADYYFVYGNEGASKPQYDLTKFVKNIPENPRSLALGEESSLIIVSTENNDFFSSKLWLWGLMAVIILLLGWFSLQMMRKSE